jgi:hypothetical protein
MIRFENEGGRFSQFRIHSTLARFKRTLVPSSNGGVVHLIAEYLEHALQFQQMADEAADLKLKKLLEGQALAYRKLAQKRAAQIKLPPVNLPVVTSPKNDK